MCVFGVVFVIDIVTAPLPWSDKRQLAPEKAPNQTSTSDFWPFLLLLIFSLGVRAIFYKMVARRVKCPKNLLIFAEKAFILWIQGDQDGQGLNLRWSLTLSLREGIKLREAKNFHYVTFY